MNYVIIIKDKNGRVIKVYLCKLKYAYKKTIKTN